MNITYLTTEELSQRIKYDFRTIRDQLKDAVFIEGTHYIRPFGGRKILFLWEEVEALMLKDCLMSKTNDSLPFINAG